MSTIQELRQEAYRVAHETQQGGNTAPRIGNLYDGIIDFIDVLNQRTEDPYYYDDTELRNAIRKVNFAIDALDRALEAAIILVRQEKQRLDNLVNTIDDEIQDKVDTMLNDAEWLQDHAKGIQEMVNEGEIYWKSEWNQSIEAYLQEVGVWAREGDVVKTQWTSITQDVASIESRVVEVQQDLAGRPTSTQWSQITQKVNSLEQSVNALYYQPDSVEALQSSITQSIDDKVASLKLETTYARLEDMGDAKKVVEWMYSAFRNQTSKDESFADIVSAGQSGFNNAISNLHTWVRAFENKDFLQYEAGASIEAKVNDAITGLYSKATPEQATTTIFSQVKKDTQDIAAIIVNATGDSSEVDIATKFANWKAGLVVQSDLAGARASLLATMDEKDAASALVLEQTISESSASLLAIMNGKVAGLVTKADFNGAMAQVVAKSDYNAASITAMVNDSGSEVRLNADKINFTFTQATNFISGDKTVMSLDGQGNLSLTGEIIATSGSIGGWEIKTSGLLCFDSAPYIATFVDSGTYSGRRFVGIGGSDGYTGSGGIRIRNDDGTGIYIFAQNYKGNTAVGLHIEASNAPAIVATGQSQFEKLNVTSDAMISGKLIVKGNINPSTSLPSNAEDGTIFLFKGTSSDKTITASYACPIMASNSRETRTSYDIGATSAMFVKIGSYWVHFNCS